MDILRRFFLFGDPIKDSVCRVLREAIVHIHLVQLDNAFLDVAGALREDFSLVGQERERYVVDGESELVCPDIIENRNLPLGLTILQFERKHPWFSELSDIQIV